MPSISGASRFPSATGSGGSGGKAEGAVVGQMLVREGFQLGAALRQGLPWKRATLMGKHVKHKTSRRVRPASMLARRIASGRINK